MIIYDYTYWSSPVQGQVLRTFSPNTLFDKFYSFNGTNWFVENREGAMTPGRGYIIRAPQAWNNTITHIRVHAALKRSWMRKWVRGLRCRAKPPFLQTSQAEIAIRVYRVVQTGANTLLGGFHAGFFSSEYQSLGGKKAPRDAAVKQRMIQAMRPRMDLLKLIPR